MSWFDGGRSWRRRAVAWLRDELWIHVVLAALLSITAAVPLVAIYHREGGFEPVAIASPRPDDPPPGTCVASLPVRDRPVQVVSCGAPHRGEILGYRPVGSMGTDGSGRGRAEALANFECRWLLAAEDLGPDHDVSWSISDASWWDPVAGAAAYYATCVLRPAEPGALLPPGRVAAVEPHEAGRAVTVPMPYFGRTEADSVPVGVCLGKGVWDTLTVGLAPDPAPAARCRGFHAARVVGRPALATPGTPWSGAEAVATAADEACRRLPTRYGRTENLDVVEPDAGWWAEPGRTPYAVCVAVSAAL